jgi:hypothetical protein
MKKNILGAVVFFSLLALAGLSLYIYASRTGSGHRLREFDRTAGYLEERIGALEKQRALLDETAAALDAQATELRTRADELSRRTKQIDSEIANMRDLIGGVRRTVKAPLFSLRGFRLTLEGGLVTVAFLAIIWILYTFLRPGDEEDAILADTASADGPAEPTPVPGSVREEEFPLAPPEPDEEQGPEPEERAEETEAPADEKEPPPEGEEGTPGEEEKPAEGTEAPQEPEGGDTGDEERPPAKEEL